MQFLNNKPLLIKILIIFIIALAVLTIFIIFFNYSKTQEDSKINKEITNIKGPVSDNIIFKKVSKENALEELKSKNIDYYLSSLTPSQAVELKDDKDINLYYAYSQFAGLALNPAPGKGDQLNPFSIQKVRLALNYLIDKKNIVDSVYKGFGTPVAVNMTEDHPSYKNIKDVIDKYNFKVDKDKAELLIDEGMKSAGAEKINNQWNFNGQPIELNIYIDSEAEDSKNIAELISLELENVNFKVNKNYYARSDKEFTAPMYSTDPNELKWHFYITGWIYYGASKYISFGFPELYEEKGGWKYENSEIEGVKEKLKNYSSQEEWEQLNKELTDLYLKDSRGIWLAAKQNIFAADKNVKGLTEDKYIGLRALGNIRQAENKEKNTLTIGSEYLYEEEDSWNPVVIEHIGMMDIINTIHDPAKWVDSTLETKPFRWKYSINIGDNINVPTDAFVWDVDNKKWSKVGEGIKVKSEITFDLSNYLGTNWHHGQKINWADILYFMASTWDRAYDEEKQKISSDRWQGYFDDVKGLKISENNLIIYLDKWDFDEDNLLGFSGMFQRSAPLEIYAASDKLVFGNNGFEYGEVSDDELEKLNLTDREHIAKIFDNLGNTNYSEIEPFISINGTSYFSEEEFTERKRALSDWYNQHEHLIISDGPFYLDRYNSETGDIILKAFRDESYPFRKGIRQIE